MTQPYAAERFFLVDPIADRAGNEARGDRRAVIMQDFHQLLRIDLKLIDQKRAQLGVAVLLDDETRSCSAMKCGDLVAERETRGRAADPV